MEGGGRQSRLLSRLLSKLRGDQPRISAVDKPFSFSSTAMSESTGCGSRNNDEDDHDLGLATPIPTLTVSNVHISNDHFAANLDLRNMLKVFNNRYGGQYLTPEQLPEFCNQLHNLVEVIRNIQSYAKVTGEYPSELERRLEIEAQEVAALAAEARNARDAVMRVNLQRQAVHAHWKHLVSHLAELKETEIKQMESTVRLSDRKLFKNWKTLKDSIDPTVFEPMLQEIKTKQTALECLMRLVESRRLALSKGPPPPQPLPPPPQPPPDAAAYESPANVFQFQLKVTRPSGFLNQN